MSVRADDDISVWRAISQTVKDGDGGTKIAEIIGIRTKGAEHSANPIKWESVFLCDPSHDDVVSIISYHPFR